MVGSPRSECHHDRLLVRASFQTVTISLWQGGETVTISLLGSHDRLLVRAGFQTVTISLWGGEERESRERGEQARFVTSFYVGTSPSPCLNLIISQSLHFQMPSQWGLRLQNMSLRRHSSVHRNHGLVIHVHLARHWVYFVKQEHHVLCCHGAFLLVEEI